MIRYATVGTGWITESFIRAAALTGRFELAGVYSRDGERGRRFAEKTGAPAVYTDFGELAAACDAVYIASPNALHAPQSRFFLEAGRHVLCEKPATVTAAEFRELTAVARERGVVYMEAIMTRHIPARDILRVAVGRIGRVHTARLDFSQLSSKYPAYLAGELPNVFNPAMAGGSLMDLGVYGVYAAVDLFGPPERIEASAGLLASGADGYGTAVLGYPELQVTLTHSKLGQSALGSEILGDRGTVTLGSVSRYTPLHLITPEGSALLSREDNRDTVMSGEAAAFARYILEPDASAAEYGAVTGLALSVAETMERIRQCAGISFEKN